MAAVSRRIALAVLLALEEAESTLDTLLARELEGHQKLSLRDRALVTELVFGVVRWRERLDWAIRHYSRIPFRKIAPPVRNILRLALYQIQFLTKIPPSAAVNDAVDLAKKTGPRWVSGYVNGVLRSAVRANGAIPLPDETDDPILSLSVVESHPAWLVEKWVARMGLEGARGLCRADNRIPPVTIRTNTLKTSRAALSAALSSCARQIYPTECSPVGLRLTGLKAPLGDMVPFQEGWFQVQDEAAQLVGYLLDPKPGEAVLDGCSGLGGKAGHIAELTRDEAVITAADHHVGRLEELQRSMARLGIRSVTPWHGDLGSSPPQGVHGLFDRVLLDAPCSGLGVIRRNPDIKWSKQPEDLPRLQQGQMLLLNALARTVRPGGVLCYCVCSLEPEEGEGLIARFLKTHGDFVIESRSSLDLSVIGPFVDSEGFLRTSPVRHEMDGFFAVRMKRLE